MAFVLFRNRIKFKKHSSLLSIAILLIVLCHRRIQQFQLVIRTIPSSFDVDFSISYVHYDINRTHETYLSIDNNNKYNITVLTTSNNTIQQQQQQQPTPHQQPLPTPPLAITSADKIYRNISATEVTDKNSIVSSIPATTGQQSKREKAIVEYINQVKATGSFARHCTEERKQVKHPIAVNLSIAHNCLKLTTTTTTTTQQQEQEELIYPDDADEHYNTIRIALSKWAQHSNHIMHTAKGYSGPWLENHFIHHFETLYDDQSFINNNNNETNGIRCLSYYFGPFIPIFIPWVDHYVQNRFKNPKGLIDTLRSVLRPNVPYITVSVNAEGLVGKNEFNMVSLPNLLVLSAGGYGHVPIPSFLMEQPLIHDAIIIPNRLNDISYVGSLKNAPYRMRHKMNTKFKQHHNKTITYQYYYGPDWKSVMSNSKFSLVPRGFGRTAYHLMETLQMGYIPIYIYLTNDSLWIPYSDLYDKIGFKSDIENIDNLIAQIKNLSIEEIQQREEVIESLRNSHFTPSGVLDQIGKFITGQPNDLRCQPLPKSVRGI